MNVHNNLHFLTYFFTNKYMYQYILRRYTLKGKAFAIVKERERQTNKQAETERRRQKDSKSKDGTMVGRNHQLQSRWSVQNNQSTVATLTMECQEWSTGET